MELSKTLTSPDDQNDPALTPTTYRRLRVPRNPEILASALSHYLQAYSLYPNAPYVHPRPITFPTGESKCNWVASLPDGNDRETYPVWWRASKHGKSCLVGCFSTWTRSWVGDPTWDDQPWHTWAVAILKLTSGTGKCMIIYDCDPHFPSGYKKRSSRIAVRPHRFLLPVQVKLIHYLRRREKVPIRALDRCLYYTMKWIRKVVRYGDVPFMGFNNRGRSMDPRTKRCALFTRL
ncbi:hypothetical protein BJX76DRAFT_364122 [Aspergillus varians]